MAVDVLPTGAPMWYDRDPDFAAVSLAQNGTVPYQTVRGTRLELEPFAIAVWVSNLAPYRSNSVCKSVLFGETPTLFNRGMRTIPMGNESFSVETVCTLSLKEDNETVRPVQKCTEHWNYTEYIELFQTYIKNVSFICDEKSSALNRLQSVYVTYV
ncbi:MAG: hypothetical protein WC942_10800 [Clostridia bacterium]